MLLKKLTHNLGVAKIIFRKYNFLDIINILRRDIAFDFLKGVDTFSTVSRIELFDANEEFNNRYVPSTFEIVETMLELYREILGEEEIKKSNFIDFGSGKSKVLIPAAKFGFQLAKGIEFTEKLHHIAVNNMQKLGLEDKTLLLNIDATKYTPEPADRALYFFNPFMGEILDKCLSNIASIKPDGKRVLILINPVEDQIFMKYFKKIKEDLAYPGGIKYCVYVG